MGGAGDYDRRLQIVRTHAPVDDAGQAVPQLEPTLILETWCSWRQVRGDEGFQGNQRLAQVEAIAEIPFPRSQNMQILLTDQVEYHGVTYDLIETRELGRMEGLQLLVRRRPVSATGRGPGVGP